MAYTKQDWQDAPVSSTPLSAARLDHVEDGLEATAAVADSKYLKPGGGIPSSDMAAAVQNSLGKADTALQAVTKADIGLGSVDNTSDLGKPISTATQTALDAKQAADSDLTAIAGLTPTNDDFVQRKAGAWTNRTLAQVKTDLALGQSDISGLVAALSGKQAADQDLTDIAALTPANNDVMQRKAGAWSNRTIAQLKTDLAYTKSDLSLGSVDNTSDLGKPISTATQTALDLKATQASVDLKAPIASPTFTGTVAGVTKAHVGLGNVDNTSNSTERAAAVALTNKTIDADLNTITNIEVDNLKASTLVTAAEGIGANNNDTSIPTSAAVKAYADSVGGGGGGGGGLVDAIVPGNNIDVDLTDPANPIISVEALTADDFTDGTTNKVFTATEKTKLSAITGTNTGDQTTITGNAATATKLATARNINGVAFDGTAGITINAVDSTAREPAITVGTSAQYYRGDKSMQTLNQDAVPDGTTNKAFTATDKTKLAGISTGADVTGNANVDAAGAVMNTDSTTAVMGFVIDEDSFASNLATKVPTQQSVKAYVDATVGSGGLNDIVEDLTPQLGGDLDLNSHAVGAATAADLTKLHALAATSAELNYVDGVTSAIQTQLDAKVNSLPAFGSKQVIVGGVLQTHNGNAQPVFLPHLENDIAFNVLRGGSVSSVTKNGVADTLTNPNNCFAPDLTYSTLSVSATTDVFVVEVTLCVPFTGAITSGAVFTDALKAYKCKIEYWDSVTSTWSTAIDATNPAEVTGHFWATAGSSSNPTTKVRWTFTNFVTTGAHRITQLYVLASDSPKLSGPFLPRGGGEIYGPITAYTNPTADVHLARKKYVDDADALKANLASPTFTGTVAGITAAMVGLGNVSNTSDATERAAVATLTNKSIALGSNTVTGTVTEFNAALTAADFYTSGGTDVPITDGGTGVSTLPSGLLKGAGVGAITAAAAGTDYVAPGGALGTPSSGTLTNVTGLPIAGLVSSTATALGVGSIELGHASDTTLSRSAAGKLAVEGVDVVLLTGAQTLVSKTLTAPTMTAPVLGTPASGTLTNCTGLPIAGLAASTATAVGVGSVELGHATDTTLSRSAAGVLAVEGVDVPTVSSTSTLTNKRISVRVGGTASSGTPTASADSHDQYNLTALAAAAAFGSPTGTPVDGQKILYRIKDNGTARALSWNAVFRAIGVALPSTTVISKTLYVLTVFNFADTKWDVLAVGLEA